MDKEKTMLERAMCVIDDYLNAGFKEERTIAHEKAKVLYKEYYGIDYANKVDRQPTKQVSVPSEEDIDLNCKIITGCSDCPFSYEYDMSDGYGCALDKDAKTIDESEEYFPITPEWCPIKNKPFTVKYQSQPMKQSDVVKKICICKQGKQGRTVDENFHQVCDFCGGS